MRKVTSAKGNLKRWAKGESQQIAVEQIKQGHLPKRHFQASFRAARVAYHLKGFVSPDCKLAHEQHALAQEQLFRVAIPQESWQQR